jgi:hypothetical protein
MAAEKVEGEAKDRWEVLVGMNPGDNLGRDFQRLHSRGHFSTKST